MTPSEQYWTSGGVNKGVTQFHMQRMFWDSCERSIENKQKSLRKTVFKMRSQIWRFSNYAPVPVLSLAVPVLALVVPVLSLAVSVMSLAAPLLSLVIVVL